MGITNIGKAMEDWQGYCLRLGHEMGMGTGMGMPTNGAVDGLGDTTTAVSATMGTAARLWRRPWDAIAVVVTSIDP